LNKKDQLALRSFRRRAVKPADKIARDFILVHGLNPLTGFAWDPGVESRRSDRSPLHDVRQRRHLRLKASGRRKLINCGRYGLPAGGARRDRTDDLLLAKQALSQLSYGPDAAHGSDRTRSSRIKADPFGRSTLVDAKDRDPARRSQKSSHKDHGAQRLDASTSTNWWAWDDSNVRPHPYQGCALTT
jgi:hypothetical protein